MNEINETFFQVKPDPDRWYEARVQFMNDCFNLNDINFISAVWMEGTQLYRFKVKFYDHESMYDFQTKSTALKAQRELARAYTRTGEFKHVTTPDDTRATESTVGA